MLGIKVGWRDRWRREYEASDLESVRNEASAHLSQELYHLQDVPNPSLRDLHLLQVPTVKETAKLACKSYFCQPMVSRVEDGAKRRILLSI